MVAPIIWAGVALGGLIAGGYAVGEAGDAAAQTTKLVKWATIGGVVYVSYEALKAAGALK